MVDRVALEFDFRDSERQLLHLALQIDPMPVAPKERHEWREGERGYL
jgi:hypothetical protein